MSAILANAHPSKGGVFPILHVSDATADAITT
eukprot:CAMPEP_0169313260 /NCGR_PEP_ID=MMETSP1017-20121227/4486_1 /TAXON_ID=342587 /ORGANISM="Karlodinium micrum, Strain CCMP2283" /LENGTH=31 /DNA_ID= /DNA_START= /DNA_END= /DNA_ORIENTATION=